MIGTPAGLTRPLSAYGDKRPPSAAGIRQDFEGHGIAIPPELLRGYLEGPVRPATAPLQETEAATPASSSENGRSRRKKREPVSRLLIHVHLREKVLPVSCGLGEQQVFWLGVTGVQRYVVEPDSYTRPYSEELTPKGVLAEDGQWIDTTARIRDELRDGDHVWIDVGDGVPLSVVRSRKYQLPRYQPVVEDTEEVIEWEEEEVSHKPRMSYSRAPRMLRKATTFLHWKAEVEAREEDLWQLFVQNFEAIRISDLPGAADYSEEIKGVLWKHFEQIAYLFHVHASKGATGAGGASGIGVFTMSLQEFWHFCKECLIPSPYLNLAKIDLLFVTVDSKNKATPHNPSRAFVLHEFMEGLVRLSVLKQRGTKDAKDAGMTLPDCIEELLQRHVLKYGLGEVNHHSEARQALSSLMVRRVFNLHQTALRRVFRKWAKADKSKETIELSEFLELFKASALLDRDVEQQRRRSSVAESLADRDADGLGKKEVQDSFIFAQLDDAAAQLWRDAKDPCTSLIFPEFMEAIGRVGLLKYRNDTISTPERKVHEFCQLVLASPAGVPQKAAPGTAPSPAAITGSPPRAGRRGVALGETAGHSMHAILKYAPGDELYKAR